MKLKLIIALIAVAALAVTCKHEIPLAGRDGSNVPVGNSGSCHPDSVYFANTVLPLIISGCALSGCHDATTHEEGLVLNNYTGIMTIVKAGNATESKLYKVITSRSAGDIMPPPPHAPFSSSAIASIQKWINQGARNSQCAGSCDSTVFTYSGAVAPLINTYCKGCHNPASLGGGIDVSTYNGVKSVALNGKLLGSIQHASGYKPMPQGTNKLPDCQIRQIEKWVQAGSANN